MLAVAPKQPAQSARELAALGERRHTPARLAALSTRSKSEASTPSQPGPLSDLAGPRASGLRRGELPLLSMA
jgi:hypothetical protein